MIMEAKTKEPAAKKAEKLVITEEINPTKIIKESTVDKYLVNL